MPEVPVSLYLDTRRELTSPEHRGKFPVKLRVDFHSTNAVDIVVDILHSIGSLALSEQMNPEFVRFVLESNGLHERPNTLIYRVFHRQVKIFIILLVTFIIILVFTHTNNT